jgi:threonine dehydrogenase-like Zn-dependent dehydrogenase
VNFAEEDLAAAVAEESGGAGADVVIVAAPSQEAQQEALRLAAMGGRINFFAGLASGQSDTLLDSNLVHYKELLVTGSTGCSTADCRRSVALVESGALDLTCLISARFALRDAAAAFGAARNTTGLKVILEPALR